MLGDYYYYYYYYFESRPSGQSFIEERKLGQITHSPLLQEMLNFYVGIFVCGDLYVGRLFNF